MKPHFHEGTLSIPWSKDRLIGQKAPFKLKEIWAIRIRLQLADKVCDWTLFNLAIDSKLQDCDLVNLEFATSRKEKASSRAP